MLQWLRKPKYEDIYLTLEYLHASGGSAGEPPLTAQMAQKRRGPMSVAQDVVPRGDYIHGGEGVVAQHRRACAGLQLLK